jgi:glucokinase
MYYIGVDLGGTNIAIGVVDENHKIIKKGSTPTLPDRAPEMIVRDMATLAKNLVAEAGLGISDIAYVGIASPGIANCDTGVVEYANNLPFQDFPIAEVFKSYYPVKAVYVENDANAAALAEALAGAAKGTRKSVMITLGTGVGGGIVIDGKVYSGYNHAGGELGHIVIEKDGRLCSCGRRGCLEAYASATALIRQTKAAMQQNKQSIMWQLCDNDLQNVTGITAFEAMRKGDPTAKEVVDKYIYYISVGIVDNIYAFQPEVICLGGGISGEGDNLIAPIIENVKKQIPSFNPQTDTKTKIAELGNDAGIIGAAYI